MPGKTIVRIEDVADGPPKVEVADAALGYNVYVGPLVNNPAVEHGGLINLLGVDQAGLVPEQGWRFLDPSLPQDVTRNGLHVLWITHDQSGPFCSGDLQIGVNTRFLGSHYANPIHTKDKSLGRATNAWVTVYSDEIVELWFKSTRGHEPAPVLGQ